MCTNYKTTIALEISLDELREKTNEFGSAGSFEYKLGLYYEPDPIAMGEIANIMRLLENGFLPPSEKTAVMRKLDDCILEAAGRKAYERAVKSLRRLLLQ